MPFNGIIIIFFALYGISNLTELKQRVLFFLKRYLLLVVMLFLSLLVWIPQFIYLKKVTGGFFLYSYSGESFFFLNPKILEGLFSFRKGWLLYTPMMGFALIGLFSMKNDLKKIKFPIVLFFIINIYIIFSWWCWWYGGSFGQRSLIESYAILAIPFASFIKLLSEKKWYYNTLFYGTAAFFIWLNIFQTYQFEHKYGSLHHDGMSKELYVRQFGKLDKISDFDKYIDWPNYENAKKGRKKDDEFIMNNPEAEPRGIVLTE